MCKIFLPYADFLPSQLILWEGKMSVIYVLAADGKEYLCSDCR